jgi:hypothetical protein
MIEKQLEHAANEKIVEAKEESEEDDEITFTLFVDGKLGVLGRDITLQLLRRNTYCSQGKTQRIWLKTARSRGEKC